MEDEEYARQLFEILTRPPDPDLLPGHLGADWSTVATGSAPTCA